MSQKFDDAVRTVLATQTSMWAIGTEAEDISVYVLVYDPLPYNPDAAQWSLWINHDWFGSEKIPADAKALSYKECELGLPVVNYGDAVVQRLWKGERLEDIMRG